MTGSGYRRKDIKRACDCCGAVWFMSEMRYVGQNRWFCPDDAPGLTAEQISRHNARVRPLIVKQARHPRARSETPSYELSEAACYRTVMDFAGVAEYVDQNGAVVLGLQYASSIARCGLYLDGLAADGIRPALVAPARAKMLVLADQLLALQWGSPTGPVPSTVTGSMVYGAIFAPSGLALSLDGELAGKLFLRAYAATGNTKYLDGADRCAMWLRAMQRTDAINLVYTVDGAGSRLRIGGFAHSLRWSPLRLAGLYSQGDMGLSFLKDMRAVRGGSYQYGAPAAVDFVADTRATIDQMIAEALDFYVGGAFRSQPLISSAGKAYFDAKMADGTGSDAFGNFPGTSGGEYQRSAELATGLRSLYDYEGATARVLAILSWIRGATYTGDGDPTFCPAQYLTALTAANDGELYDLEAGALLSPVTLAAGYSIRDLKDGLDNKHLLTADSTDAYGLKNGVGFPYVGVYPGPTGQLGFDGTAPMVTRWVEQAAVVGGLYRLSPRAQDTFPDGYAEVA